MVCYIHGLTRMAEPLGGHMVGKGGSAVEQEAVDHTFGRSRLLRVEGRRSGWGWAAWVKLQTQSGVRVSSPLRLRTSESSPAHSLAMCQATRPASSLTLESTKLGNAVPVAEAGSLHLTPQQLRLPNPAGAKEETPEGCKEVPWARLRSEPFPVGSSVRIS